MKKLLMSVAALFLGWSMVSAQDYSAEFINAEGAKGSFSVQNFTLEGKAWYATCGYWDNTAGTGHFRLGRRAKDADIAANVESKFTSLGISEKGAVLEMKWDLENIKGFSIVSSYNWEAGNKVTLLVSTDEGATYQIVSTETIANRDDADVERTFSDETARAKARYALALEGKTEGVCRLNLTKVFTSEETSNRVAQPFFTPADQTFTESITVTLACATEDAEIFYSLTDAEPTTKYTEPIELKATTTITAIAKKEGMEDSKVATAKYTLGSDLEINTIADLWTKMGYPDNIDESAEYTVKGKVVVTAKDSKNSRLWVQDKEQENGRSVLIFLARDKGYADINVGDVVENLTGTLKNYNGTLEVIPTQTITATDTATPYVIDVTIPELKANPLQYQSALIRLEDVTFVENGRFVVGSTTEGNYTLVNGNDTLTFRTDFADANYLGSTIPSVAQKITGICATYQGNPQITARNKKDMVNNDEPEPPTPTANENGAAVKFSAYPNPTTGLLTLDVEEADYSVRVFTVSGVEVMNLKALNGKTQINLEGMAKGIYVVEIATANGASRAKVVLC